MTDRTAWREERRQVAVDPNATIDQLYHVAAMFPVEVLENPVLQLEMLVNQRGYEQVVRRAWNRLAKDGWEAASSDTFLTDEQVDAFYAWCLEQAKTLPNRVDTMGFLSSYYNRDQSPGWVVGRLEGALEDGFARAKIVEIFGTGRVKAAEIQGERGEPVAWARIAVMVHAADALHHIVTGRPYPWPIQTMKPNRRRRR